MKRSLAIISFFSLTSLGLSQDTRYAPVGQQIPPPTCLTMHPAWEGGSQPCSADTPETWLKDMKHWRVERRIRVGYDGSRYGQPELKWTQSSFIQPQMMVEDRYFYDPVAGKYTVDRYLDDLEKRYGGIDSVLIWPTYPNMGIDNRNQHDMIRAMPGGVAGVRQMVADFHKRGVRVLFPMMMWDQGTRDPGKPWPDAIAEIMAEVGADGINGDTQDGVPLAFTEAADKIRHPLVFEPEGGPADEALAYDVMTWGQYAIPPFTPRIDHYKWLERRHMVNVTDRWNRDHAADLQYAFFNGVGFESWESVWGIWNGITPRDAEATRRVGTMERALAPFLVSSEWEPFAPMNALRSLREPMADRRAGGVDDRESQRIRPHRRADGTAGGRRRTLLRSLPRRRASADAQRRQDSPQLCNGRERLRSRPRDENRARREDHRVDGANEIDDGEAAAAIFRTNGRPCRNSSSKLLRPSRPRARRPR